ncbi:hydroxyacylglutathione hydrolase [Aureococcus anophagefferens]|nr:hydroxyacylglutathione hydrolase [Aureococcus anophagefferens]
MGETSDKENEQNEKERKKEMAEFRKIAKQLKAKDAQTKLGAIAKCGENAESLRRGECFVPLLQLCVAKKKNAAIVAAAVGCAAEKKKNRVPGGKLFTDLLSHENPDIVGGAMGAYALVACARAGRVEEVRRPAPGPRLRGPGLLLDVDASGGAAKASAPAPRRSSGRRVPRARALRLRRRRLRRPRGPCLAILDAVTATAGSGGGDAARRRGGADAVVTLAKRLAETSDAAAGPPRELLHCLNIVERLLVAIAARSRRRPTRRAPGGGGAAAAPGPAPAPAPGGDAAAEAPTPSVFLSCDKTTGALYGALKFFGDASAEAVPEGLGDCVALVCKCLDRSVDAFKEDAYRRLTASPEAAVPATLLKVLVAPGAGEMRFSVEKALHKMAAYRGGATLLLEDAEGGATLPPPAEGDDAPRTATPRLDAAAIAAALAVDDADGKYRAIRFAAKLSDRRENALILTPVVAPLLAVVEAWAADAQPAPWPTGISNEAGAALA